jgi:hypothetical protein
VTFTCPTRNCRRTDAHDAKGCVVAWTEDGLRDVAFVGPLPATYPVFAINLSALGHGMVPLSSKEPAKP